MEIVDTHIKDLKVVIPKVYNDERGFFLETYNQERYKHLLGLDFNFVQDNHSSSTLGVLRGLHFQKKNPQGKLGRVS